MTNAEVHEKTPSDTGPDEDSGLRFILSILFLLTVVVVLTS